MLGRQSDSIPDLDVYYQRCVVGGDGAFVLRVTRLNDLAEAIRRKLLLEISGLKLSEATQPFLHTASAAYDCFIGEELEEKSIGKKKLPSH